MLMLDSENSNLNTLMRMGDVSRLQSGIKLYSAVLEYKLNDLTRFNGTTYYNITAITVPEVFDPIKWKTIDSNPATVEVRSLADFPDAQKATIVSMQEVPPLSGNIEVETADDHLYTNNQTVDFKGTGVPAYDGKHSRILVKSAKVFELRDIAFVSAAGSGETVRCLVDGVTYVLHAPITAVNGWAQVETSTIVSGGGSNVIRSSAIDTNLIDMPFSGPPITIFSSPNVFVLDLREVLILDFGTGIQHKLFDINVTNAPGNGAIFITDVQIDNVFDLGSINGAGFAPSQSVFSNWTNGFNLLDCRFNGLAIGVNTSKIGTPFLTVNTLKLPISTFNLETITSRIGPGVVLTDFKPTIDPQSNINVLNGSTTFGGKYFKPSTTLFSRTITLIEVADANNTRIHFAALPIIPLVGSIIEILDTINYNGRFPILGAPLPPSTTTVDIPRVTIAETPTASSLIFQPRIITSFAAVSSIGGTISIAASNGAGGTTITSITPLDSEIQNARTLSLAGTSDGDYDGTFRIFNRTPTTFDIPVPFGGATPGGSYSLFRTIVTVAGHGLTDDTPILINKSRFHDGGFFIHNVTADTFIIDLPFITADVGEVFDGSLDQKAINVQVAGVSGEISSIAKSHTFAIFTGINVNLDDNDFHDLALGVGGNAAKEANDNELWRLINEITGEVQYRGLEPFSGQLIASCSLVSNGGLTNHTIRAIKNDGVMFDEFQFKIGLGAAIQGTPFSVGIQAVTGDRFRLQLRRDGGTGTAAMSSIDQIIQ